MNNGSPAKILIIDDNEMNCDLLTEHLKIRGFEADAVYNGNDALLALRKKRYAIALIDINLPDYDGMKLLEDIKTLVPDILFAMITGVDSIRKASIAFQNGAFGYYMKPFVMAELIHGVQEALEKKELRHQLKLSQSQIIQQEKMAVIGQLAAGVAHEVNNPVGFINSNLSTLAKYIDRLTSFVKAQDEVLSESAESESYKNLTELRRKLKIDYLIDDIGDLLAESREGTERIKKIVQDLKLFSRQDAEDKSLANINDSIESALNIVWNELKYKCEVHREFGELPLSVCYPQKLSQVFMNILVNAGHAIEEKGEITIRSRYEEDCNSNRIEISDNGSGMPAEVKNRIFDPFYSTKEPGKGTGLGMSIAAEIIQKHRGTIEVESQVGLGTTFQIYLPVTDEA